METQAESTRSIGSLQPIAVEKEHVFDVYDSIAPHWHHTRGKRKVHWARVKTFIEDLPTGSIVADVGCGDGKYFGLNKGVFFVGCDTSFQLLDLASSVTHPYGDTLQCDAVAIPYLPNLFDSCICIAVLHHLATENRRLSVISECIRITKPGGLIMIQAWALEQGEESRIHDIASSSADPQDKMVPWHLQRSHLPLDKPLIMAQHAEECEDKSQIKLLRYCHLYRAGELESLVEKVSSRGSVQVQIELTGLEKSNWFVVIRKL